MADTDAGRAGQGALPSPGGPTGDPLWDDSDTPPRVPTIPDLHLDGFDGPLDLLLDLAERQRIDLGRLSIAALATQFVAALERLAGRVALERRADWLVMATHLVLLRSRLLFPATPEAAAEAEREAAAEARRLEELRFIRDAAAWLSARPALGVDVFTRPAAPQPHATGYVALMEACLTVLRGRNGRPADTPVYHPAIPDLWRVPAALARIRVLLAAHPAGGALAGFLPVMDAASPRHALQIRAAVASTFVAGLELARVGQIDLRQAEAFAPMTLRTRADRAEEAARAAGRTRRVILLNREPLAPNRRGPGEPSRLATRHGRRTRARTRPSGVAYGSRAADAREITAFLAHRHDGGDLFFPSSAAAPAPLPACDGVRPNAGHWRCRRAEPRTAWRAVPHSSGGACAAGCTGPERQSALASVLHWRCGRWRLPRQGQRRSSSCLPWRSHRCCYQPET